LAQGCNRRFAATFAEVVVAIPAWAWQGMEQPAEDKFFDGEGGLVQTFDFDYDKIIAFEKEQQWCWMMICPPACIVSSLCCVPCFLDQNIEWSTRAQHLALTQDGIRYVVDKHKTGCGFDMNDSGKTSKTVPYDKITDCDVQEPAGTAVCCCVENVLTTVTVDTASGSRSESNPHELSLVGLKDATGFKQKVWEMKRAQAPTGAGAPGPTVLGASAPLQENMSSSESTGLLREIRDELVKMNKHMGAK